MSAEVWNPEKNIRDNPHGRPNYAWDCEYMLQAMAWMMNLSKRKRPESGNAEKAKRPIVMQGNPRNAAASRGAIISRSAGDRLGALRRG